MSKSIHPTAIIHPSAHISDGVTIGPFCVIEKNVFIGHGTIVQGAVRIGEDCEISAECVIKWGAILTKGVVLSNRVFVGPQAIFLGGHADRTEEHGTFVCSDTYIGAGVKIAAAIRIKKKSKIGVNSFVNKNIDWAGTYVGCPAKLVEDKKDKKIEH